MKHLLVQFVLLLTIALVSSTAWATIPNAIVATVAVQAGPAFNLSAASEPAGKHTGSATRIAPVYLASGDESGLNGGRRKDLYSGKQKWGGIGSQNSHTPLYNNGYTRTLNIHNTAGSMTNVTNMVNKDKGHTRTLNIHNNTLNIHNNTGSMLNVANTVNNKGHTRTGNIYNNAESMSNVTNAVNKVKGHTITITGTGNIVNSAGSMTNVTNMVNKDKGHTRTLNIHNNTLNIHNNTGSMTNVANTVNNNIIHIH